MAGMKNAKRGRKGGLAVHTSNQHNASINPVAAGVMGAVAGAAVGATAAVVLADEKTRNKIGDVVNNLSKNAPKMMEEGKQRVKNFRDKATDVMGEAQDRLDSTSAKEMKAGSKS